MISIAKGGRLPEPSREYRSCSNKFFCIYTWAASLKVVGYPSPPIIITASSGTSGEPFIEVTSIWIYKYVFIYIHVCKYVYTHIYICLAHVSTAASSGTSVETFSDVTGIWIQTYIYMHTPRHYCSLAWHELRDSNRGDSHICIHTYIYMCVCEYIYVYIHMYSSRHDCSFVWHELFHFMEVNSICIYSHVHVNSCI